MAAAGTDFYAILGLTPRATQTEITHAYRALLRQHHPDTRASDHQSSEDTGSDEALQQVLAAYAVLGDPQRRASYDRQAQIRSVSARQRWQQPGSLGPPPIQAGPVHWHAGPSPQR